MTTPAVLRWAATITEQDGRSGSRFAREITEARAVRLDGTKGPRPIVITYYAADADHTCGEVSIEELHGLTGERSTLIKRRRVDKPANSSSQNELERLHPKGQGLSLQARLHWPDLDCVLQAEDIRAGEALPLFGLQIMVIGPEDEVTRNWLRRRKLPGATLDLPLRDGAVAAAAAGTAEDYHGQMEEEEPLSFFLGGGLRHTPHPHLRSSLDERDGCIAARNVRQVAWPALRDQPAVRPLKVPPTAAEARRLDRAMRYGDTRVIFRARDATPVSASRPQQRQRHPSFFLLSLFAADETLQVHEVHQDGRSGMGEFCRPDSKSGGERSLLLKRCRAPKSVERYLAGGRTAGDDNGVGDQTGGSDYVGLSDLRCGGVVCVMGRLMRIVCCEPSSRTLLEEGGLADELLGGKGPRTEGEAQAEVLWRPGVDLEPWQL
jgi:hypothetical protein